MPSTRVRRPLPPARRHPVDPGGDGRPRARPADARVHGAAARPASRTWPPATSPSTDRTARCRCGSTSRRRRSADRPALLWLHGGAFMFGDLDMPEADLTAREICTRAGAVVVSVDYRLAVGGVHHPVPLDDCVAATRWLRDLGRRPAASTRTASTSVAPAPAATWPPRWPSGCATRTAGSRRAWSPIYPVLHPELPNPRPRWPRPSTEVPPVLRFTPEATAGINANYLGGPLSLADGYSFPALADVTGLCPTLLVDGRVRRPADLGRRLRRRSSRPPGSTYVACSPRACCTASSTCPPTSSRSSACST